MQERLREAGIRHQDVAEAAGVSRSYVTLQLNGYLPMTREVTDAMHRLIANAERGALRKAARILDREGEAGAADRARLVAHV